MGKRTLKTLSGAIASQSELIERNQLEGEDYLRAAGDVVRLTRRAVCAARRCHGSEFTPQELEEIEKKIRR